MVKKYKIHGLDCANCAREVEEAVKKYNKVQSATLSFFSETLTVDIREGFKTEEMLELAYKVEPDIRVIDIETNEVFMNEFEAIEIDNPHIHSECNCGHHSQCSCNHEHHNCSCSHNHEDDFEVMAHSSVGAKLYHHEQQEKREKWFDKTQREYYKHILIAFVALIIGVAFRARHPYGYMQTTICWIGYVLSACSVLNQAFKRVLKGNFFNEYTLMAVATLAAVALNEYAESIIVILLYQVGELLQYTATKKSRASIRALLENQEGYAEIKRDDSWATIPVDKIAIGDIIRLKAGAKAPVDGNLMGPAAVHMNTSQITGESVPRHIDINEEVVAGYINGNAVAEIQATSTYDTSTVAQIVATIENATEKKSKTEKLTGEFAKIYTPIMFAIALAVIFFGLITNQFGYYLYIACEILIISCPCALVIAIPLIYFIGLGAAARQGIIIKGANVLERIPKIETIALDKTGTLTDGNFALLAVQVNAAAAMTSQELLEIVAHVESCSNHPLAKIIVRDSECTINPALVSDVVELPGHGVIATYNGRKIIAGNAQLMQDNNISFTGLGLGATVIHVAVDGVYIGAIVLGDTIKTDAYKNIADLQRHHNLDFVLLSGDSQKVVTEVAQKAKIKEAYGDLRPNDKTQKVVEMQKRAKVLFVGDGINDGPALASADVGVAMGKNGTDVAIESSDVVLLSDKISSLHMLFDVADTVHNVALITIAIIMVAKVAILLMSLTGYATLWMAIFADVGLLLIALVSAFSINLKYPAQTNEGEK